MAPVVSIIIGCFAVAIGILAKTFYAGDVLSSSHKKFPLWLGRLIFLLIGLVSIAEGIKALLP